MKLSEEIKNELTLPRSWGWADSLKWVLPKVENLEKENEGAINGLGLMYRKLIIERDALYEGIEELKIKKH